MGALRRRRWAQLYSRLSRPPGPDWFLLAILAAPLETLARLDRMMLLYHSDMHRGANFAELEARLREAGFDIEYRKRDPGRGWILARQPRLSNR